jgi:hypothetical protein
VLFRHKSNETAFSAAILIMENILRIQYDQQFSLRDPNRWLVFCLYENSIQ